MEPIILEAGPSTWVFCLDEHRVLRQVGFGPTAPVGALAFPPQLYPLAYPTFGEDPFTAPALRITNASGVLSTRLRCVDVARDMHDDGDQLTFTLCDEVEPVTVTLVVRSWKAEGFVEAWTTVTNDQSDPIEIHEFAAATPVFAGEDPRLDHFTGDWGAEFTPVHESLTPGLKVLESRALTRPAHEVAPYLRFSPNGPAGETDGVTLAAALAWGGNTRIGFDVTRHGLIRSWFGQNPTGAEVILDPGESLATPRVLFAWSDTGTRTLTHRLHRWIRNRVLRDGNRERAVVVNNWEATGFSFDASRLSRFCAEAAEIGGEVFLLDDGWFGDEFPRDDDTQGLGDWTADRAKLPDGLAGVGRDAAAAGVRFGVWVEPEMVNPASRLYRDHPDWVVAEPGRPRREERNQLQLDLARPDVRDHVRDVLDRVLEPDNGVSYVKWDANRMVTEPGSTAVPATRQGTWPSRVVWDTWATMASVAEAHPDVEMMLCASGGGRMDLGTLAHFHEVWLSDNTDPVDRVRMQWRASEYLPVAALAAHVTRWGQRPVDFACAVAMSARFGFDLNKDWLRDDEWAVCRRATAHYKALRSLIQHGDLVRLVSPERGPSAALAYLAPDRKRGVVFAYRLPPRDLDIASPTETVPLDELEADHTYVVAAVDLRGDTDAAATERRGEDLMRDGLDWPTSEPCTARIWTLS